MKTFRMGRQLFFAVLVTTGLLGVVAVSRLCNPSNSLLNKSHEVIISDKHRFLSKFWIDLPEHKKVIYSIVGIDTIVFGMWRVP